MIIGFIIWTACAVLFVVIGVITRRSKKPAGVWANAKPPDAKDIKDVGKYNRALSVMWFVFAALFELAGLPMLVSRQNSPLVFVSIIGTVVVVIGMMIAATRIEAKYRK